jgi:hypothetical protein
MQAALAAHATGTGADGWFAPGPWTARRFAPLIWRKLTVSKVRFSVRQRSQGSAGASLGLPGRGLCTYGAEALRYRRGDSYCHLALCSIVQESPLELRYG